MMGTRIEHKHMLTHGFMQGIRSRLSWARYRFHAAESTPLANNTNGLMEGAWSYGKEGEWWGEGSFRQMEWST